MVETEKEIKINWLNCQGWTIKLGSSLETLKKNIEKVTGIPQNLQMIQLDKAMIEEENLYDSVLQKQDPTLRVLSKDPEFVEYNNRNEGQEYEEVNFEREDLKNAPVENSPEENRLAVENSPPEESKDVELTIIVKSEKHTITIKDSRTILELKYEIEKNLKIASGSQILFCKGILLRNNEKISLLKSNIIKLMRRITGEIFGIEKVLNLKILHERSSYIFVVPPIITIGEIKTIIFNQHGIDQNTQSLYFKEKLLEDNQVLNATIKRSEPELVLITRQIGLGVKKKKVLTVDLRTKQKSYDKPNEYIKPITRPFNIFIQCKNKCEETKHIQFDEGLIIGYEDFQINCRCGLPVNIDIVVHEASWKFFGIKNGNRIILNNRRVKGDDFSFILEENKQINDLSMLSEFRFEVKKIKASKS